MQGQTQGDGSDTCRRVLLPEQLQNLGFVSTQRLEHRIVLLPAKFDEFVEHVSEIRLMIDTHAAEAERTGARIVHACGMDSIPSDLGVAVLQQAARERFGGPCSHVRMRVTELSGGFSGGTAGAMLHGFEAGKDDPTIRQGMIEPYFLCPEGQRDGPEPLGQLMSVTVEYDEDLQAWVKPFFMGPMNTKIVRRTNAILDYPYGEDFRYEEARLVGDGWSGRLRAQAEALAFGAFGVAVAVPPTRSLLERYVLPASGEGPSQASQSTSSLEGSSCAGFHSLVM